MATTRSNRSPDHLDVYRASYVIWTRDDFTAARELREDLFGGRTPEEAAAHAVQRGKETCRTFGGSTNMESTRIPLARLVVIRDTPLDIRSDPHMRVRQPGRTSQGAFPPSSRREMRSRRESRGNEMSGAADPRLRVSSREGGHPWQRLAATAVRTTSTSTG